MQLAEVPPAPCRQYNRIDGPSIFVPHNVAGDGAMTAADNSAKLLR
jgi:hypothetical protein